MTRAAIAKTPPVTERGRRTRQRLLEAAERVFAERGFQHASIAHITQSAGIGLGTFYVYFPNKETVLLEVVGELGRRLEAHVGTQMALAAHAGAEGGARLDRQRAAFKAYFTFLTTHPWMAALLRQAEQVDPVAWRSVFSGLARGWARGLRDGMTEGAVGRFDPEALAWMLMGVAEFIGLRFVVWEQRPISDELLDDVLAFVEGGVRAKLQPRAG